ncbi:MAG: DNA methyltransferase [Candidatus Micrarchaeia archaeon]
MLNIQKENFFQTKYGIFICEDARIILPQIESQSIDIIITDPPYQKEKQKLLFNVPKDYGNLNLVFELEDEFWRVLKKDSWLIMFWGVKNLKEAFKFKKFEYVWQLIAIFPSSFSKCTLGDRKYFIILVFKKGNPKVVFKRADILYSEELPFIQIPIKKPDFKPTGINARLIQMFSKKNDTILDPFAGWGSLQKVCEMFERKWIAIEKDRERFEAAKKFIETGEF